LLLEGGAPEVALGREALVTNIDSPPTVLSTVSSFNASLFPAPATHPNRPTPAHVSRCSAWLRHVLDRWS
jgi:hypothetical protein